MRFCCYVTCPDDNLGILTDFSLSHRSEEAAEVFKNDRNVRLDPESIATVGLPKGLEIDRVSTYLSILAGISISSSTRQICMDLGAGL